MAQQQAARDGRDQHQPYHGQRSDLPADDDETGDLQQR